MSVPNPTERGIAAAILAMFGTSAEERALLDGEIGAAERTSPQTAAALRELVRERDRGPQMN